MALESLKTERRSGEEPLRREINTRRRKVPMQKLKITLDWRSSADKSMQQEFRGYVQNTAKCIAKVFIEPRLADTFCPWSYEADNIEKRTNRGGFPSSELAMYAAEHAMKVYHITMLAILKWEGR